MITFFARGRAPMICLSSSAVLILWRYFSVSDDSTNCPLAHELEPTLGCDSDGLRIPKRRIAPVVDIGDDFCNALLETHLWLPTEFRGDAANVGPCTVGLSRAFRNMGDFAAEQFDQSIDRLPLALGD